jgi:hypothetical protein
VIDPEAVATSALLQYAADALGGFPQAGFVRGVGDAQVAFGGIVAKIQPGCGGHAGFLDEALGEGFAAVGEARDVGVEVKRALGLGGELEADITQGRQQGVAAVGKGVAALLEDFQGGGGEGRQGGMLGGVDGEMKKCWASFSISRT